MWNRSYSEFFKKLTLLNIWQQHFVWQYCKSLPICVCSCAWTGFYILCIQQEASEIKTIIKLFEIFFFYLFFKMKRNWCIICESIIKLNHSLTFRTCLISSQGRWSQRLLSIYRIYPQQIIGPFQGHTHNHT